MHQAAEAAGMPLPLHAPPSHVVSRGLLFLPAVGHVQQVQTQVSWATRPTPPPTPPGAATLWCRETNTTRACCGLQSIASARIVLGKLRGGEGRAVRDPA